MGERPAHHLGAAGDRHELPRALDERRPRSPLRRDRSFAVAHPRAAGRAAFGTEEVVELFLDVGSTGRSYAEIEWNPGRHRRGPLGRSRRHHRFDKDWNARGLETRVHPRKNAASRTVGLDRRLPAAVDGASPRRPRARRCRRSLGRCLAVQRLPHRAPGRPAGAREGRAVPRLVPHGSPRLPRSPRVPRDGLRRREGCRRLVRARGLEHSPTPSSRGTPVGRVPRDPPAARRRVLRRPTRLASARSGVRSRPSRLRILRRPTRLASARPGSDRPSRLRILRRPTRSELLRMTGLGSSRGPVPAGLPCLPAESREAMAAPRVRACRQRPGGTAPRPFGGIRRDRWPSLDLLLGRYRRDGQALRAYDRDGGERSRGRSSRGFLDLLDPSACAGAALRTGPST